MATDEAGETESLIGATPEFRELIGLYDAPAFARRGQDVEYALARIDARCRRERMAMLEMVRLRLRQWASVAAGPEAALEVFVGPIDGLWTAAEAPAPAWADRPAPRKLRGVGRDLVASVERFNRRWSAFLDGLDFAPINATIDRYNRYYVLEKECSLGSARLASRHFVARPWVSSSALLDRYPPLPVPEPRP